MAGCRILFIVFVFLRLGTYIVNLRRQQQQQQQSSASSSSSLSASCSSSRAENHDVIVWWWCIRQQQQQQQHYQNDYDDPQQGKQSRMEHSKQKDKEEEDQEEAHVVTVVGRRSNNNKNTTIVHSNTSNNEEEDDNNNNDAMIHDEQEEEQQRQEEQEAMEEEEEEGLKQQREQIDILVKQTNNITLPDLLLLSPDVDKVTQKAYMSSILSNNTGVRLSIAQKLMKRIDVPNWFLPKTMLSCPHDIVPSGSTNITIYSPTYGDRSGAVIEHMISAYSYAYKHGFNYGGSIPRYTATGWDVKQSIHEELIRSIGLDDVLQFVLPPSPTTSNDDNHDDDEQKTKMEQQQQQQFDTSFFLWTEICARDEFSSTFIEHLQSKQKRTTTIPNNDIINNNNNNNNTTKKKKVAVHVRRGDAQPCTEMKFRVRYSPNSYYLKVIQKYVVEPEDNAEVTIYSESDSFESFDEFITLGYNIQLDGSVIDAWNEMRTADILIISSSSSFSIVPALFNRNNIYFKSFKRNRMDFRPSTYMNNWFEVSKDIQIESDQILNMLIKERCQDWLDDHPKHKQSTTKFFSSSSSSSSSSSDSSSSPLKHM